MSRILALQKDPLLAAKILCPKELIPPHQIVQLLGFWNAENSFSSSGRSTGKTHGSAFFSNLWCATHPNSKVLVLAQKFRSGQQVLEAMELIIRRNPELKKCVELNAQGSILTRGASEWFIRWRNGSICRTTASDLARKGARVRGLRCNILILDEFATLDIDVVEAVFLPCCSIRVGGLRRVLMTTTGGYKPSGNWNYCKRIYKEFRAGNPEYFFCCFSYLDIPPEFDHIIDHKAIKEFIENADPDMVAREVFGKWTPRGNTFFPANLVEINRLRAMEQQVYAEHSSQKGAVYALGCDFAFTGMDDTAITVFKRLAEGKWAVVQSFAENTKKGWAEKNAEIVYQYYERFQPAFLGFDRAGGEQVVNKLKDYYKDRPDECPIPVDAEPWERGKRIIRVVVPSSTGKDNNTRLNTNLLRYLDGNGNPKLLIPGDTATDDYESLEELDELRLQLLSIQSTKIESQDGFFKFTSSMKKDRYSSLLYGINTIIEYIDPQENYDTAEGSEEDDFGMMAMPPPGSMELGYLLFSHR